MFLMAMGAWATAEWRPWERTGASAAVIREGIDPNRAPWWELSMLPRLGPSVSSAIVDHRAKAEAETSNGACVFGRAADLLAVRGIGPKMLLRLGPHLRFDDCEVAATGDFSKSKMPP